MIAGIRKVQRAFDVTTPAQEAALASLDAEAELARRRKVNREAMAALAAVLRERGFEPLGPAAGNFQFVDVGRGRGGAERRAPAARRDRPADGPFGAPSALRITAGHRSTRSRFSASSSPQSFSDS